MEVRKENEEKRRKERREARKTRDVRNGGKERGIRGRWKVRRSKSRMQREMKGGERD